MIYLRAVCFIDGELASIMRPSDKVSVTNWQLDVRWWMTVNLRLTLHGYSRQSFSRAVSNFSLFYLKIRALVIIGNQHKNSRLSQRERNRRFLFALHCSLLYHLDINHHHHHHSLSNPVINDLPTHVHDAEENAFTTFLKFLIVIIFDVITRKLLHLSSLSMLG